MFAKLFQLRRLAAQVFVSTVTLVTIKDSRCFNWISENNNSCLFWLFVILIFLYNMVTDLLFITRFTHIIHFTQTHSTDIYIATPWHQHCYVIQVQTLNCVTNTSSWSQVQALSVVSNLRDPFLRSLQLCGIRPVLPVSRYSDTSCHFTMYLNWTLIPCNTDPLIPQQQGSKQLYRSWGHGWSKQFPISISEGEMEHLAIRHKDREHSWLILRWLLQPCYFHVNTVFKFWSLVWQMVS